MSEGRSAPQANGGLEAGAPQSLCLIARFHHCAADPVALAHHLGLSPSKPFSVADLLRAAQRPRPRSRLQDAFAPLAEARQARTPYLAAARRTLSDRLAENGLQRERNAQELSKAERQVPLEHKNIHLAPGMNLTAEIKTGQRRVIDYLLSPIQKAGSESLRER